MVQSESRRNNFRSALEPDLQDLTAIAHEPSSSRICKSNCPVATHVGQLEPSATLIRSPGGSSGFEVRFRLGGNHNGTVVFVAVVEFFIIVMATTVGLSIMLWRIASMSMVELRQHSFRMAPKYAPLGSNPVVRSFRPRKRR